MSSCPDGMIPGPGGKGCMNAPAKMNASSHGYRRGGRTVKKYPHGGIHMASNRPMRRRPRPLPGNGNGNPYGPGMRRGGRLVRRNKPTRRRMARGGRFGRPVVARRGRGRRR